MVGTSAELVEVVSEETGWLEDVCSLEDAGLLEEAGSLEEVRSLDEAGSLDEDSLEGEGESEEETSPEEPLSEEGSLGELSDDELEPGAQLEIKAISMVSDSRENFFFIGTCPFLCGSIICHEKKLGQFFMRPKKNSSS